MSALLNGSGLLSIRRNRCKTFHDRYHQTGPILDTWNLSGSTSTSTSSGTSTSTSTSTTMPKNNNNEGKSISPLITKTSTTNQFQKSGLTVDIPAAIPVPIGKETKSEQQQQREVQIETTSEVTHGPEQTGTTFDPSSPLTTTTLTSGPEIRVKYWLWIGNEPLTADKHNLTVHVPINSTFFHLMLQAAQMSEAYE